MFSSTFTTRFWAKVQKGSGCWIWTAAKNRAGYGKIGQGSVAAGPILAHRASFILHHGEIPAGYHVCHSCDNPACVNPAHLFAGTNSDNRRDSLMKGRPARGERHPNAKLTEQSVQQIRKMLDGGATQAAVAAHFGVGHGAISKIHNGERWRHQPVAAAQEVGA